MVDDVFVLDLCHTLVEFHGTSASPSRVLWGITESAQDGGGEEGEICDTSPSPHPPCTQGMVPSRPGHARAAGIYFRHKKTPIHTDLLSVCIIMPFSGCQFPSPGTLPTTRSWCPNSVYASTENVTSAQICPVIVNFLEGLCAAVNVH